MQVRRRQRIAVGCGVLLGSLLAACGGDDLAPPVAAPVESEAAATAAAAAAASSVAPPRAFTDDPTLVPFLLRDDPILPARFGEIPQQDREPILSLGLVRGAARVVYTSPATGERLTIDVLRLQTEVRSDDFFDSFADALAEHSEFRAVRTIGVLRGLGERARRYAFSVEGDAGEAAALVRGEIVALVTYRRPPGLRQALDVRAVLTAIDVGIIAAPEPASVSGA